LLPMHRPRDNTRLDSIGLTKTRILLYNKKNFSEPYLPPCQ
jgi:hypothetical protein